MPNGLNIPESAPWAGPNAVAGLGVGMPNHPDRFCPWALQHFYLLRKYSFGFLGPVIY